MDNVNLGLTAAVRKPFNNYAANLSWSYMPSSYYGTWMLSLFGEYNAGKNTLPSTYNAGISADYFFDKRDETVPVALNLRGERNRKVNPTTKVDPPNDPPIKADPPISDDLVAWTGEPAVYMPQVLAIIDQSVTIACPGGSAPTLISPIPAAIGTPNPLQGTNFNEAIYFSGKNLTFSIVSITPALTDGDFISAHI